jgi:hypothetical protein
MEAAEKAMAAETDRTGQLLGRAEKSAAGIIIVTGFQLLNLSSVMYVSSTVRVLFYLSLAALCASLFFALFGLRIKGYGQYPRGNRLWENLKPDNVSDDAAKQAVIQLLLENREQNARLNDAKTRWLSWCGALFFAGFVLVITSRVLAELAYAFRNTLLINNNS